jgi:hypothetical protein
MMEVPLDVVLLPRRGSQHDQPRTNSAATTVTATTTTTTTAAASTTAAAAAAAHRLRLAGVTGAALDISAWSDEAGSLSDAHTAVLASLADDVSAEERRSTAASPVTPVVTSPDLENSMNNSTITNNSIMSTDSVASRPAARSKTPPPPSCIPSTWGGGGDAAGGKRHRPPSPMAVSGGGSGVVAHCIVLGPDGVLWSCSENSGLLQVMINNPLVEPASLLLPHREQRALLLQRWSYACICVRHACMQCAHVCVFLLFPLPSTTHTHTLHLSFVTQFL